jgi:hypothetical protein
MIYSDPLDVLVMVSQLQRAAMRETVRKLQAQQQGEAYHEPGEVKECTKLKLFF